MSLTDLFGDAGLYVLYTYLAFLVVVPFVFLSLGPEMRLKFRRRIKVAVALLLFLTPILADVPYALAIFGTPVGAMPGLEVLSLWGRVPLRTLLASLTLWSLLPLYHIHTHEPGRDITFVVTTVLISDA